MLEVLIALNRRARAVLALCLAAAVFALCLPSSALAWKLDASWEKPVREGVLFTHDRFILDRGIAQMYVVSVDPTSSYSIRPVVANNRIGTLESVASMAKRVGAVAAINGGFFDTGKSHLPVGLVKIKNRVIFEQFLNRAVLGINEVGQIFFSAFTLHTYLRFTDVDSDVPVAGFNRPRRGDEVVIYTPEFGGSTRTNEFGSEMILRRISPDETRYAQTLLEPDTYVISGVNRADTAIPTDGAVVSFHQPILQQLDWLKRVNLGSQVQVVTEVPTGWDNFPYLLGGGPMLLSEGKIVLDARREHFGAAFRGPKARTAVGRSADGRVYIVVVDGDHNESTGVTWDELAVLLKEALGLTDAMGFDGGGSSTMFVGDEVVNNPADGAPRRVSNILAVAPWNETF